jgi:formate/nitrite transporter
MNAQLKTSAMLDEHDAVISRMRPALDGVVHDLAQSAQHKADLGIVPMLIKGALSGALLGLATTFCFLSFQGLAGGLASLLAGAVFPVGFAVIVLLKLELVTGNFAVLTVGALAEKVSLRALARNWSWVYFGNFLGSVFAGLLLAVALTHAFLTPGGFLAEKIVAVANAKTLAYQQAGMHGWVTVFVKGILCNWLVALAAVLGTTIKSVPGKIIALWLPLWNFVALGFEHAVVNLFVIPTGMLLGADISMGQWLVWNFVPVTLGNLVGGAVLTGMALYYGCRQDA